jgi:hypothetical protein
VPDLQIGTALYELKCMRSDHSHSNYTIKEDDPDCGSDDDFDNPHGDWLDFG